MLKEHIIQTYGEVTQRLTAKLQKLKKQKASAKCRWIFLSKCITHDVLPKSFQTRPLLRTRRGFAATKRYNKEMLKITRDQARLQHIKLCKTIQNVDNELQNKLTEQDYTTNRNVTEKSRENKFVKERKRLLEKFTKLVEHTESKEKNKHARDGAKKLCNEVYDLKQAGIDDNVKAYLRLGPTRL